MRATEICGEVFCEIWAVFLTVWLTVRNATAYRPECHTSACRTPHFGTREVWHLPCRSVAFRTVKCGICFVKPAKEMNHHQQQLFFFFCCCCYCYI